MADRKSLLLEARACVGSDNMFKGCVRANPLWGEPCAGSMPACWWALLRCCQRHRDNGQSMQNHSRSADGSGGGGINETRTRLHTITQYKGSTLVAWCRHTQRWKVRATFSFQEIKHSHHNWPWDCTSRELYPPHEAQTQGCSLQSVQSPCGISSFWML